MNEELETIIGGVLMMASELGEARKALDEIAAANSPIGFIGTMDDYRAWNPTVAPKTAMHLNMEQAVNAIESLLREMIWEAFRVLPKGAIILVGGRLVWKHHGGLYIDNGNNAVCFYSHSPINISTVNVWELGELTTSHLPTGFTMGQYAKAVDELLKPSSYKA